MNLVEWTAEYIDYLNYHKGGLISKKVEGTSINCEYEGKGNVTYVISDKLDESSVSLVYDGKYVLVCLHNKKNVEIIAEHWEKLCINKDLKIIFVDIINNGQWAIIPYIHNKITEKGYVKKSLISLYSNFGK